MNLLRCEWSCLVCQSDERMYAVNHSEVHGICMKCAQKINSQMVECSICKSYVQIEILRDENKRNRCEVCQKIKGMKCEKKHLVCHRCRKNDKCPKCFVSGFNTRDSIGKILAKDINIRIKAISEAQRNIYKLSNDLVRLILKFANDAQNKLSNYMKDYLNILDTESFSENHLAKSRKYFKYDLITKNFNSLALQEDIKSMFSQELLEKRSSVLSKDSKKLLQITNCLCCNVVCSIRKLSKYEKCSSCIKQFCIECDKKFPNNKNANSNNKGLCDQCLQALTCNTCKRLRESSEIDKNRICFYCDGKEKCLYCFKFVDKLITDHLDGICNSCAGKFHCLKGQHFVNLSEQDEPGCCKLCSENGICSACNQKMSKYFIQIPDGKCFKCCGYFYCESCRDFLTLKTWVNLQRPDLNASTKCPDCLKIRKCPSCNDFFTDEELKGGELCTNCKTIPRCKMCKSTDDKGILSSNNGICNKCRVKDVCYVCSTKTQTKNKSCGHFECMNCRTSGFQCARCLNQFKCQDHPQNIYMLVGENFYTSSCCKKYFCKVCRNHIVDLKHVCPPSFNT